VKLFVLFPFLFLNAAWSKGTPCSSETLARLALERTAVQASFKRGDRVIVPRSDGSKSVGTIESIDPESGRALVVFPDSTKASGFGEKWAHPRMLRPAGPESVYEFNSKIVSNYTSSSGEVVEIDPNSSVLQEQMALALERMAQKGAKAHVRRGRPTEEEMRTVSEAWLRQSKENLEQTRPIDGGQLRYGAKREPYFDEGGGIADLGKIAEGKAAVCRELSLFGSLALSELGFRTRVGRGNVVERGFFGGRKVLGGHAWIEFLDPQTGEVIGVLDSNNMEKFYPSRAQYFREASIDPSSVTTTVIAEPATWQ